MIYQGKRIVNIVDEYDDSRINEWEPYEQIAQCCQEIPGADPCTDEGKREPWNGKEQSEDDWSAEAIYADYKRRYGDKLIGYKVENVGGPTSGGPCGTQYTTWSGSLGCCEIVVPMYWGDGATTEAVSRDGVYTYSVESGTLPYSFSVLGSGVRIIGENQTTVRVEVDDCMCAPCLLLCTDGCGQTIIKLLYLSTGSWDEVAQVSRWSDYGWHQDGIKNISNDPDGARVYIYGFNDDRSAYSIQAYGVGFYADCDSLLADYSAITGHTKYSGTALVIPQGYDGHIAIEGTTIFYRDVSDDPNYGPYNCLVFFALTTLQESYEYEEPPDCAEELLYDVENSVRVIASDSYGYVFWEGGIGPYSLWFVTPGSEVYVDAGRTQTEQYNIPGNVHSWKIYTGEVCEWIQVVVKDACGTSVTGDIYPTDGSWVVIQNAFYPACFTGGFDDFEDYWQSLGLSTGVDGTDSSHTEGPYISTVGIHSWAGFGDATSTHTFSRNAHVCTGQAGHVDASGLQQIYYISLDIAPDLPIPALWGRHYDPPYSSDGELYQYLYHWSAQVQIGEFRC